MGATNENSNFDLRVKGLITSFFHLRCQVMDRLNTLDMSRLWYVSCVGLSHIVWMQYMQFICSILGYML